MSMPAPPSMAPSPRTAPPPPTNGGRAPTPMTLTTTPMATWPIAGDVADLETIIQDQAKTNAAQAVLIDGYQADLNSAQNPLPGTAATGTGTTSGTPANNLAVTAVTGVIYQGAVVTGTGIPAAPPNTTMPGTTCTSAVVPDCVTIEGINTMIPA